MISKALRGIVRLPASLSEKSNMMWKRSFSTATYRHNAKFRSQRRFSTASSQPADLMRRNVLTALVISGSVVGIYAYTIHKTKENTEMELGEEFDEERLSTEQEKK